ncbi:hypothetical protein ACLB2K_038828 [Fragaria x ananassa]
MESKCMKQLYIVLVGAIGKTMARGKKAIVRPRSSASGLQDVSTATSVGSQSPPTTSVPANPSPIHYKEYTEHCFKQEQLSTSSSKSEREGEIMDVILVMFGIIRLWIVTYECKQFCGGIGPVPSRSRPVPSGIGPGGIHSKKCKARPDPVPCVTTGTGRGMTPIPSHPVPCPALVFNN